MSYSAPVPRIGTLLLQGTAPSDFSLIIEATVILPTNDGHPGKRVNYATEVNHDIKDKQDKDNP